MFRVSSVFAALWLLLSVVPCAGFLGDAAAQAKKEQKAGQPKTPVPADIDSNGVLILTRNTIMALDHANRTGNYTVLRDLGAPGFQSANSAARLAEIFANLRAEQIDLGGVAILEPKLTLIPQIETNGMMHFAGVFPSVPMQVSFELLFAPVQGEWKIFAMMVNVGRGGPTAPAGSPSTTQPETVSATPPVAPGPNVSSKKAKLR